MNEQIDQNSPEIFHNQPQKQKQSRIKSLSYLIAAVLCYNLSSFYFGYCMVYFNAIKYQYIEQIFDINMSRSVGQGIYSGCISFGALLGAFSSIAIIKRLSRRQCFFAANGLAVIGGLLILIKSMAALLIGRLIQGFCVGFLSTLTPIMVKQISPVEVAGSFGAFLSPTIAFGFFIGYLLPYIFQLSSQPNQFWQLTFGFTLLSIILQTVLLLKVFNHETPKYLLLNRRKQQAQQLIQKIYKSQYTDIILRQKIKDLQIDEGLLSGTQRQQKKQEINNQNNKQQIELPQVQIQQIQEFQQNQQSISQQRKYPPDVPLAKFFAFCLQIFQQLTGINVIVIFGGQLAQSSLPHLEKQLPLIINGEKMIIAIIAVLMLNKVGRRTMLIYGTLVVFISLVLLFVCFIIHQPEVDSGTNKSIQKMILFAFVLYISSFVLTMGPITWLYIPEVVQPPTVPYTTMTNWALAFTIISLFPLIRQNSSNKDCPWLFGLFSLCTLFHFFLCKSVMVETKDKKQFEIREEYESKRGFFYRVVSIFK